MNPIKTLTNVLTFTLLTGCFAWGGESASAKAPGKGEMILFRATGPMWGATENRFSEHAFSLKSNRGVALWRDTQPDKVVIINPENRTYLAESLFDYLDDNHYGAEVPIKFDSYEIKPHEPLQGHPCLETVYRRKYKSRGSAKPVLRAGLKDEFEVARTYSLQDIEIPPAMYRAWTTIMLSTTQKGFPVTASVRPGRGWYEGEGKADSRRDLISFVSIKFVPFAAQYFEIPRGFRQAKDKSGFYLSESGELKASDIDDLFRSDLK